MSADYLGPNEIRPHDTIWHVPLSTDPFGQVTSGAATIEHLLAGTNPTGRDCIRVAWTSTGTTSSGRRLLMSLVDAFKVARGSMIHVRFLLKGQAIQAGWKPTIYINGTSVKYGGSQGYNTQDVMDSTSEGTFDWKEINYSATVNDDFIPSYIQIMCYATGAVSGECWITGIRVTVQEPADTTRPAQDAAYVQPFGGLRGMQLTPNPTRQHLLDLGLDYGANLARFQFNTWSNDNPVLADKTSMAQWDAWFAVKLALLQQTLGWARQSGIKLTVSMMVLPGGATALTNNQVPYNSVFMLKYLESWKAIAAACLGAPEVIAFDVMNEPGYAFRTIPQGPGQDFRSAQIQAIDAIREIDPTRWCVYEVNGFDEPNRFHYLKPIDRDRIMYSVHMYKPTQLIASSNTTLPYPGGIMTSGAFLDDAFVGFSSYAVDKNMLRRFLEPARRFQLAYKVPIYLGEFSIPRWVPGAAEYLRDVSDIADEYGWAWTYHAFREANAWDVEYATLPANQSEGVPAVGITDRGAVLLAKFALNSSPYTAAEQAPIAPTISVTETFNDSVLVSWAPARCLIGSWLVEHRAVGGAWAQATVARDQTSYAISGLAVGMSYEFRVTLINAHGSAASGVATLVKAPVYMLSKVAASPAWAYSVSRKVVASYSGPLMRVRRSSDNAELDIQPIASGANAGLVDSAALLAHVGAGDGFVVTLYDQSGNARHITQQTAGRQTKIVSSGVVEVVNAKPSMAHIPASSPYLAGSFAPLYGAGSSTIIGVARNDAAAADSYLFCESHSTLGTQFIAGVSGSPQSNEVKASYRNDAGSSFVGNGSSVQVSGFTNGTLRQFVLVDTGAAIRVASNTTAETQDSTYSRSGRTVTVNQTAIGCRLRGSGADKFPAMHLSELIAFPANISDADKAAIKGDQTRWYGL